MRVGIDIGGTTTKIAVLDPAGGARTSVLTTAPDDGPEVLVHRTARTVLELVDGAVIDAVGVGVPGLVEDGRLVSALNLPHWENVAFREAFSSALGAPVTLQMDAACAAHAELHVGAHPHRSLLVLTLGTGVGAAVVLAGEVTAGGGGLLAVPGADGTLQTLEARVGAAALARAAAAALLDPAASAPELAAAAAGGDRRAGQAWDEVGDAIGFAAAQVVHLLLVRRVVVGGGTAAAGAVLLDPARAAFRRHLAPGLAERSDLVLSRVGPFAGAIGAAVSALECR